MSLRMLDLFSGIGGFSLAARMVGGIETKQFVENNSFCQKVLTKNFSGVPIHDDVQSFATQPGLFDLITAGYPCQGNSTANPHGKGLQDERSGLLYEVFRILEEAQPKIIVLENVPPTQNRRWDEVARRELEKCDFTTYRIDLSAKDCGLWHLRKRTFLVGYANGMGFKASNNIRRFSRQAVQAALPERRTHGVEFVRGASGRVFAAPPPGIRRMVDGVSSQLDRDRIHGLGNAVSPQAAAVILKLAVGGLTA
jgi:DNA (cytosine-5)-methyltransferase 1